MFHREYRDAVSLLRKQEVVAPLTRLEARSILFHPPTQANAGRVPLVVDEGSVPVILTDCF
jgi:hypothetical protein